MPKIGILTFHNNENRGAVLQAYSLYEALQEVFTGDIEIVEYRTKSKEKNRRNTSYVTKRPSQLVRRIKHRRIIENFFNNSGIVGIKSITTDDHDAAVDWLEQQNFDMLVTGSDEIWKLKPDSNNGFFSRIFPSRPFPSLYFLDPRLSPMKVAYAASANQTRVELLSKKKKEQFESHIADYDHISVRDNHTEKLLTDLNIGPIQRVPDPTLLIDIPESSVQKILQSHGIDFNQPILAVHSHGGDDVFRPICEYYRDRGYQIVTPTSAEYADIELIGELNPFEYYTVYKHFDFVVTSSLHSTIFSLKHRTPFATIDTNSVYKNIESKTKSLLNDFDLLNRHIDAVNGYESKFYDEITELEEELNETHINNRIKMLRAKGFDYLQEVKENYEKAY